MLKARSPGPRPRNEGGVQGLARRVALDPGSLWSTDRRKRPISVGAPPSSAVRPTGPLRGLLQPVEQRRALRVAFLQQPQPQPQPQQAGPLRRADPALDANSDRGVHVAADLRGHRVEGGERRQIQPGIHHLLPARC